MSTTGIRSLVACAFAVGAVVTALVLLPGQLSESAQDSFLPDSISGQMATLPLDSAVASPDSSLRRHMLAWQRPLYQGSLNANVVESLVRAKRSAVLEARLTAESQAELQSVIGPIEATLRQVGAVYAREIETTKALLRARPDRCVHIKSRPRELDANYDALLQARSNVTGQGAVWGDIEGDGEVHVIVKWSEWPVLKQQFDDQVALINERHRLVGQWIADRFAKHGMRIFGVK